MAILQEVWEGECVAAPETGGLWGEDCRDGRVEACGARREDGDRAPPQYATAG